MKTVACSTGYKPRPLQKDLHSKLRRFSVLVAHRRFGKTVFCVNDMIDQIVRCEREKARFAYLAPLRHQAKTIAWDYVKEYTCSIQGMKYNEAELRADFPNGHRLTLYGCDNPDNLRGIYLDGCVLDEYAQMPPRLFGEVIRPALSDRKGFAIFIGTPQGHNQFWDVYQQALNNPDWYAAIYRASETGVVDEEELTAAKKAMSPEQYAQEFECSFQAAVVGAYYGALLSTASDEGRIGSVPYDTAAKVDTWWDLGMADSTAIWFTQRAGAELHIIDYYECSGEGLNHYAKVLQDKGYVYGEHNAPHDIRVRELGSGKSRLETAETLGIKFEIVPDLLIADGIEAARNILPRCWFDKEKCGVGLEALMQYRREYNDKMKTFKTKPLHDWTSHAADAFRCFSVGLQSSSNSWGKPIEYNTRWVV